MTNARFFKGLMIYVTLMLIYVFPLVYALYYDNSLVIIPYIITMAAFCYGIYNTCHKRGGWSELKAASGIDFLIKAFKEEC